MVAYRRTAWNFSLHRGVERARDLKKPLAVFEALGCDYLWASARLHRFVLDGTAEKARWLRGTGALYHPYVDLRMLWGKKILEWTASPQEALEVMIELNNK